MAKLTRQIVAVIRMGRPFVLLASVVAHALGLAMAYYELGRIDWGRAGLSLGVLLLATLMGHYADEYADQDTDALTRRTWFSGGSGVLPAGLVPPWWALAAALVCAGLTVGLVAWSVVGGRLPPAFAWLVAAALPAGWFYSMPPLALERRGLGEMDNALLGGFAMPLSGYTAQTGALPPWVLLALLPITLSVLTNLLGVHWSDREADAAVGRRTLVVRCGRRTRVLYWGLIGLLYLGIVVQWGTTLPPAVVAASLGTLPLGVWAAARFGRSPWPDSALMAALMIAQTLGWVWARGV